MQRVLDLALFEGCTRRERGLIDRLGTTVVLTQERQLCTQGATGRQFVVILDGEATVRRDGHVVASLHVGDCVGEIALLIEGPAAATVEADAGTIVWVLSADEFDTLIKGSPTVANRLDFLAVTRAATNATSPVGTDLMPTVQIA